MSLSQKLPHAHLCTIERSKILDYLLDPAHPDGGAKARYFLRFGFTRSNWTLMAEALKRHGVEGTVTQAEPRGFMKAGTPPVVETGMIYRVVGELRTPDGRNPMVRSVWYVKAGELAPRLVTAYRET